GTRFGALLGIEVVAHRDYDILPAVDHVGAWRGEGPAPEVELPEDFAALRVIRADHVVQSARAEDHAARGHDVAAANVGAGARDASRGQALELAVRYLPGDLRIAQIDRGNLAPGRPCDGIAFLIHVQVIAAEAVTVTCPLGRIFQSCAPRDLVVIHVQPL